MVLGQERRGSSVAAIPSSRISSRTRAGLTSAGLASWAAGGTASFMSTNGAGAAALIVMGGLSCALGLIGRWPSRISMSGNEISWENIDATVDSQIRAAEDSGADDLAELRNLRDRLDVLQRTGTVPDHPAKLYDQDVMLAIRRLLPGAEITPHAPGNQALPDFAVRYNGQTFFVETKWRADPDKPMRGSTLPQLINGLPDGAKLLVIVNTRVPFAPSAPQIVESSLGGRGQIVGWINAGDDDALDAALKSLLAANSHVSHRRG